MKKTIKLISLITSLLLFFSSCQSVYDVPLVPPETTANSEIDLSEEYYTTGNPYFLGDITEGMLYEGCLIYIDHCTTTGVIGERTDAAGGKKPIYGDVRVDRIVKYNPVTRAVSSPCLDPVCNHSLESNCPMLLGIVSEKAPTYQFKGIFGDWMIYTIYEMDDEYSSLRTEMMYNLKTGEVRNVYVDELGTEVISRWVSGVYFEGKYYKVNDIMDYSNTGYKPGSGQRISDFEPDTKRYLYEYDLDTNTSKELFQIKEGWVFSKVTNKRFYFHDDMGIWYSINKDGTDERKEVRASAANYAGTYSILYNSNGYIVDDLKTDQVKEVIFDYSLIGWVCLTEKGVLSAHQTKYDEWEAFKITEYMAKHPGVSRNEANSIKRKIIASGTAQIWQCNYWGEDNHLIFELPAAKINIIAAQGDFVYAKVTKYNTTTGESLEGYESQPCCINIATGEITPIPQLDIVVPYWYVN